MQIEEEDETEPADGAKDGGEPKAKAAAAAGAAKGNSLNVPKSKR